MKTMPTILCVVLAALLTSVSSAKEASVVFKPVCVEAKLSSKAVRPGGQLLLTLRFANEGGVPAEDACTIFVHLEHPDKDCRNIVFQRDHQPRIPTSAWKPGVTMTDGPSPLDFPGDIEEGTYYLHVGVFSRERRWSDQYVGEISVSKDAPDVKAAPPKMAGDEIARRARIMDEGIEDAVVIEDGTLRFAISPSTGGWRLRDKRSDEVWHSNPFLEGLGEARLTGRGKTVIGRLGIARIRKAGSQRIEIACRAESERDETPIGVRIDLLPDGRGLKFSYTVDEEGGWTAESVRLLDGALWATDTQGGYLAVPHRLGILFPANEGLPIVNRLSAYDNWQSYSMAMVGAVRNGSAMLVWWDDAYTVLEVERSWPDASNVPGHGMVSISLDQRNSARSFVIRPLGKGGYAEIAHAYRDAAREKGFLSTWNEKIKANPDVGKIIGAADFKPFVLSRTAPRTRWNQSDEERVSSGYNFDECAQIAEHLNREVGIDRAMMVLAGWINRGYDNQHPDILPAAAECGGNEALADCSKRVKDVGFLFGLHDNYQDMYRDAPSWDESFIMKQADGSLHAGGVWAGGQAYLTCSRKALELAKRDQNIPAVKRLFDPTIYFIDTTFAAPPMECFSDEHPLTLNRDLEWKYALCEYARKTFGLFGSEEGQEWAVPCADYFEGIMTHRTQRNDRDIIVPLFEMVYGDCVNLYTHQGDRATPDRPEYILDHILYAEMPVYHFGGGLYWTRAAQPNRTGFSFARLHGVPLCDTDCLIKNTYEILSPLNRLTAYTPMTRHAFLTEDRKVERTEFGDVVITVNYGANGFDAGNAVLPQYGFLVESPTLVAFHATAYKGREFTEATMLVARSMDGRPLSESADVRIHHAFGDSWEP